MHKLLPLNDQHREDIARVRGDIWSLYADLKDYKRHPTLKRKRELQARFDAVFTQKTRYATLNRLLRRIHLNKSELLLVLERPEIPLHTNGSESDIRDHVKKQGLSQVLVDALRQHDSISFADQGAWQHHLDSLGMDVARHRNIATEAALLGSLKRRGVAQDLAIISDDAGQFNVLIHGLCWVHAERLVHKLLPLNDQHREDIARVRSGIWSLYADLKEYKEHPTLKRKRELQKRFDVVFTQKTRYATLNRLLRRIHLNKSELLLVLERPEIPLHTNDSERDIRDHVKKQKISGGTRSELGRQCRDTFSSLKKTCRKLGVSFWDYLTDRISCSDHIPLLPQLVEQRLAPQA